MWGEGGVCEEGEEVEGMEVCGEGVECVRKVKRWRGDGERYVEGAWEGVEL